MYFTLSCNKRVTLNYSQHLFKHFFAEKLFSLMKTSDIFIKNLVNKKLLLAAFYHLTCQSACVFPRYSGCG